MKLEYLFLRNIGPFYGDHTIDLVSEKKSNGFAFFADNGRGKTTLYNAMKWCLFGTVKTRVRAVSGIKTTPRIRPIVGVESDEPLINNTAYYGDEATEMSVVLIASSEKGRIQVTREVSSRSKLPRNDDELDINTTVVFGDKSSTGEKAQELIETFFPNTLQQFFFIDGEALEEYTDMLENDNLEGLKEDVESVLRLPALFRGKSDLELIRMSTKAKLKTAKKGEKNASAAQSEAAKYQRKMNDARKKVIKIQNRITTTENSLKDVTNKMNQHSEIAAHVEKVKEVKLKLEAAKKSLIRSAGSRKMYSEEAWKILIWKRAEAKYKEYNGQIGASQNLDFEIKTCKINIKNYTSDLKRLDGICSKCGQTLPDIDAYIAELKNKVVDEKKKLTELNSGVQFDSDELTTRLGRLTSIKPQRGDIDRIKNANNFWSDDRSLVKNLEEKYDSLNAKVTKEATSKLGDLGVRKGNFDQTIRRLKIECKAAEEELSINENKFNDWERKAGYSSGISDEEWKLESIVNKLISTIDDTVISYRQDAREKVEEEASKVFMEVTNAPQAYDGISLDNNFRARIKLKSGKFVTAPSSGMKSMMTISIIDGLRRVSGLDAPIFFDTPGRSLDEDHKRAMLDYFWREHNQQFLIFAHSGEYKIDATLRDFGSRIVKAWELTWPGDHHNCIECKSEEVMHSKSEQIATCMSCNHKWDTSSAHTIITELEI